MALYTDQIKCFPGIFASGDVLIHQKDYAAEKHYPCYKSVSANLILPHENLEQK